MRPNSPPSQSSPGAAQSAEQSLEQLLQEVAAGSLSVSEAAIRIQGYENLEFARVDHMRAARQGHVEVIYAAGKTKEQVLSIAKALRQRGAQNILCTRCDADTLAGIQNELPADIWPVAGLAVVEPRAVAQEGNVLVICAGTSDLPVAEEAALTAERLGAKVERIHDVGVAGIHRLLPHVPALQQANVIVCIAGMEGALVSVVAGLTEVPVIAVPTSVGYGASLGGVAALLAMLNSCASGVSVVNIDNGFGAGYQAAMINRRIVAAARDKNVPGE